jgi:hypothetical protein
MAEGDIVYDVHLPEFELPSMHVEDTMPVIQLQLAMGLEVPQERVVNERDACKRAVDAHLVGKDIVFSTYKPGHREELASKGVDTSKYYDVQAILTYRDPPRDISKFLERVPL